jgi:hypothetical protein
MLEAGHAAQKLPDFFRTQDDRQGLGPFGRRDGLVPSPVLLQGDFVALQRNRRVATASRIVLVASFRFRWSGKADRFLRHRMIEDMQVRNLSPRIQAAYVQQVSLFARHLHQTPQALGPEAGSAPWDSPLRPPMCGKESMLARAEALTPEQMRKARLGALARTPVNPGRRRYELPRSGLVQVAFCTFVAI